MTWVVVSDQTANYSTAAANSADWTDSIDGYAEADYVVFGYWDESQAVTYTAAGVASTTWAAASSAAGSWS